MRIFLEQSLTITKPSGSTQSFPAGEFYEVPDDLGSKWIAEKLAKAASSKNEVIGDEKTPKPKSKSPTVSLKPAPKPEPKK